MNKLLAAIFLALIDIVFSGDVVHYEGYKVYQIYPKTVAESEVLNNYEGDTNFDFWAKPRILAAPVDLMVAPTAQWSFEKDMESNGISYKLLIRNVEETIQAENVRLRAAPRVEPGEVTFTEFMRHDEINAYLQRLETQYPDIVQLEIIGQSFEGRNLTLIRISSGGANKPTIFADATIHAREWIAGSMALYIINQLVENPENAALYQDIDWAIIPVANPDGYEYTHTTERLWRKTRSTGTICYGVDPNRNFDFEWMVAGASSWQCSDVYGGYAPFSEPETGALRDYLLAHKDNIKLYLAIHSYGRYLIFPWGYTNALPDDNDLLVAVAERVNSAIVAVGGTNYTIGTSTNVLGLAAGCSDDYAKGGAGINLSYCVELPGGGNAGFNPPATSIQEIVQETWEGFKAYHQYIQETFV
ncbi:hypothetical protein NQ315_004048 [Exocentrus adspersus]|uniref:Zinc carboxypeptidase A 1 n=1 Tax=Exocentrus adspersus TaxID=1586481 RepID=A0AAV8W6N3_9CUCU|nr:hypothetical protein NQ315_004048 [Exocentrus adspersus]